jgi:predicted ArsR family transcriptional regulator
MSKSASSSKTRARKPTRKARKPPSKDPAKPGNSKQAQLIEMLKRPNGATIEEIVKKLEWQPHTVRGAFAGALKKKLGLDVTSEKVEGRGRVYRIAA